ncbi:hypothetical protein BTVI_46127 [Pitangus sulphuratus]|nr:hypothetical protein BTVI_46127 [Pitangus sulphuratus]
MALYVIEGLECMELTAGNGTLGSLWIRIKGQTNNVDVTVGICYKPPSQDDDADKLFCEKLRDASKSIALVLMGDFSLPEIHWEHHTAGTTQIRRFLKHLDDNFMEQILRESNQKDAFLDLLLVNRVDLINKAEIVDHLGHSNHEEIEFKISVDRKKSASKISTLDMRRVDFGAPMASQAAQTISKRRKVYAQWKQGQGTWEEYRDTASNCREKICVDKGQLKLKLARNVGDNKKSFFKYINGNNQYRNIIDQLQDGDGHLSVRDRHKAEVFNAFFAFVFNMDDGPRGSQSPELKDHDYENNQLPVDPELVRDLLLQLDPDKSMWPDRIYLRILKDLADVIAKPLSMIFEWYLESGEVSADWISSLW